MKLPIQERLNELFHRLGRLPATRSADEALDQLTRTLDDVEDELSGIPKSTPPPPPSMFDGRMYPPHPDFTNRHADGSITARTRGHIIEMGADGSMIIKKKRTGDVDFTKEAG